MMKTARLFRRLLASAFLFLPAITAASQTLGPPSLASIPLPTDLSVEIADLVIHGKVGNGGTVLLDLATVMAFPATSFTCVDPWGGKEHLFTGALLPYLLARAGIEKPATKFIRTEAEEKTAAPMQPSKPIFKTSPPMTEMGYLLDLSPRAFFFKSCSSPITRCIALATRASHCFAAVSF